MSNGTNQSNYSPDTLLEQARGGDKKAEGSLYRSEVPLLTSYLYKNGVEFNLAGEIAHAAIAKALTVPQYTNLGQCRAWLRKIALRLYLSHKRCLEAENRRMEASKEQAQDLHCHHGRFETEVINRQVLERAMAQLETEQQEIIKLYFFCQFTLDEIAQMLDLATPTIYVKKKKALNQLKTILIEMRIDQ